LLTNTKEIIKISDVFYVVKHGDIINHGGKMTEGKKFEDDFKNSVPEEFFIFRINDNQGYNETNERFTLNNPFDFIFFNGIKLYCLELKSTLGKSLSFHRIRPHQEKGLMKQVYKKDVIPGIIINYRELELTVYIHIENYLEYKAGSSRKSLPVEDAKKIGVVISQELKRTRYKYDLSVF
jgi:recombination protein U